MADEKEIAINLNAESTPILYTDNIFITTNEDGVILDICQVIGPKQLKIVARIGMSRVHSKKFLKELSKLLAMTEGKSITPEKN